MSTANQIEALQHLRAAITPPEHGVQNLPVTQQGLRRSSLWDIGAAQTNFYFKRSSKTIPMEPAEERLQGCSVEDCLPPTKPTATTTKLGQYFSKLMCLKIRGKEMSMVVQACIQCSPGGGRKSEVQSHPQLIIASLMPALALVRKPKQKTKE